MRHVTIAVATLATLAVAAMLAAAQADYYYGPRQNGNLCWKYQNGNSNGYWTTCPKPQTAQATAGRSASKKK